MGLTDGEIDEQADLRTFHPIPLILPSKNKCNSFSPAEHEMFLHLPGRTGGRDPPADYISPCE